MAQSTLASSPRLFGVASVVSVLALFAGLSSLRQTVEIARAAPDPFGVQGAQRRFAAVLPELPASATVGYLTDLAPAAPAATPAFLAAQYALAPRFLIAVGDLARKPEWAIGNFTRPGDFASAGASVGYTVARDYGQGVVLFRRQNP